MENRLKLRISRIFHSSLRSCMAGNPEDIAQEPVFISKRDSSRVLPSKQQIAAVVSSGGCGCKPINPPVAKKGCRNKKEGKRQLPDQVMEEERRWLNAFGQSDGRICPPLSPVDSYFKLQQGINKKKKSEKTFTRLLSFSSVGSGWFSSEEVEEEETGTLFSSKSLSSDSSEFFFPIMKMNRMSGTRRRRRGNSPLHLHCLNAKNKNKDDNDDDDDDDDDEGKFGESVAVVKRSRDPYNDFRTSMVEMIIQKQIYEAMDLEELLHCFLSLNSSYHHKVIVEVFTEIWETLFYCN